MGRIQHITPSQQSNLNGPNKYCTCQLRPQSFKSNQTTTTKKRMAMDQEGTTAHQRHGGGTITDALSLFASRLSHHRYARTLHRLPAPASTTYHFNLPSHRSRRFGDEELRVLEAALSAGGDVATLLSTRSAARKLLRESVAEACAAAAVEGDGARLSVADFFARAFALSGDVEVRTNCAHCVVWYPIVFALGFDLGVQFQCFGSVWRVPRHA